MKPSKTTFVLGALIGGIGAAIVPLLITNSRADTKLLPFQGRLTDAAGTAIPDGAKVVEFKLYDAPTGGVVKWAGEVHKLSVNGGLVNTMLGSKASLGSVDFSTATYLQIIVDANDDGQITAADPPLLPRQSVVPAVFAMEAQSARDSEKLQGFGWSAVFDNGNPVSGTIPGSKITSASISSEQIAANLALKGVSTGTFTGTFSGNGAALTNLPPSSIAGLMQSSQLASDGSDGQSLVIDTTKANGMKWATAGQLHHVVFTSNGTFTTPAGTSEATVYRVTCIGGGGSGAAGAGSTGGGGGGGGGTAIRYLTGLAPGVAKTVSIGAGGASVALAGTAGIDGGNTSFGADCIAGGGKGGASNSGKLVGGRGGVGTVGDILIGGSSGSGGYTVTGVSNIGGTGGGTTMGGGGEAGTQTSPGAGLAYGGGGGGTQGNVPTGAGAAGVVMIEWNQ